MADETVAPVIPAPTGLGKVGRALWKRVSRGYILRGDELVLLEMAAKTADQIAELELAMVGQPLLTKGSMGQSRENPLISELRSQRAALQRMLAGLRLPDLDEQGLPVGSTEGERSAAARAMAGARWSQRGRTGGAVSSSPAGPWSNGGRG